MTTTTELTQAIQNELATNCIDVHYKNPIINVTDEWKPTTEHTEDMTTLAENIAEMARTYSLDATYQRREIAHYIICANNNGTCWLSCETTKKQHKEKIHGIAYEYKMSGSLIRENNGTYTLFCS